MMLGCDEILTLVQRIPEEDGDRYVCVPVPGASWYRKRVVAISGEGAKPVSTCIVRIPDGVLPADIAPETGNFMVRGVLDVVDRVPAGFAGLDYIQVTAVGDNRRGNLRHWVVSGA